MFSTYKQEIVEYNELPFPWLPARSLVNVGITITHAYAISLLKSYTLSAACIKFLIQWQFSTILLHLHYSQFNNKNKLPRILQNLFFGGICGVYSETHPKGEGVKRGFKRSGYLLKENE
jgi:hypothetical protein